MTTAKRAIFLDRDGTIILDKHYLSDPSDVELIEGAKDFLHQALEQKYCLFLFSNQSGINRGYYTVSDVKACNQRMLDLLNLPDPGFIEMCMAPERPDEELVYRKPSPRFILEMIDKYDLDPKECWMIGDKVVDLNAGINANIKNAWVSTGKPSTVEVDDYI